MTESIEAKRWYERHMAYRADCHTIDPKTDCYKCSPQCPIVTVAGKPFCLLNAEQCDVRKIANCDARYPYIHYDEAKRKADFWVG